MESKNSYGNAKPFKFPIDFQSSLSKSDKPIVPLNISSGVHELKKPASATKMVHCNSRKFFGLVVDHKLK
jgi:hypothetical protein